jgi:hypothetical protein
VSLLVTNYWLLKKCSGPYNMNSLSRNLLVTVILLLLLSDIAVTEVTAPPISVTCTNLSYWQCYNVNDIYVMYVI